MQFEIKVDINGRWYSFHVERIHGGESIERFRVTGGRSPIVVQCNRPFLKATGSHKEIKWQLAEGDLDLRPERIQATTMALYNTFQAIEAWLLRNDK